MLKHNKTLDMQYTIAREIEIMRHAQRHENLIPLLDTFAPKGEPYTFVVLPYCRGGDLVNLVEAYVWKSPTKSMVPEHIIWSVFHQLAAAVAALHTPIHGPDKGQAIIHRDIKPDNVFVDMPSDPSTQYPRILLGDFGLARLERDRNLPQYTNEDYGVGTPVYQPPEFPRHSREADVWAMGAVIQDICSFLSPVPSANEAMPVGWEPPEYPVGDFRNELKHMRGDVEQKHKDYLRLWRIDAPRVLYDMSDVNTLRKGWGIDLPQEVIKPYSRKLSCYIGCAMKRDPEKRWTAQELLDAMNICGNIPDYLTERFEPLPSSAWQPLPKFPQERRKRVDSLERDMPAIDKKFKISSKNEEVPLLLHEMNTNFLRSQSSSCDNDEDCDASAFLCEKEGYHSGGRKDQRLVETCEKSAVGVVDRETNIVIVHDDEKAWETAYGF